MSTAAIRVDNSLRVTATLGVLAEVRAFVRSTLSNLGADKRTISALVQCVDEWVTNVVLHGYGERPGPVSVTARRDGSDIVVVVRDEAPAYDPATAPPFDRDLPLEQRPFGGMGISLIRDLCSSFDRRSPAGASSELGNEVTMRRAALTGGAA
ncbi:MAG: ATP-binding protein [Nocardioides sp.]